MEILVTISEHSDKQTILKRLRTLVEPRNVSPVHPSTRPAKAYTDVELALLRANLTTLSQIVSTVLGAQKQQTK